MDCSNIRHPGKALAALLGAGTLGLALLVSPAQADNDRHSGQRHRSATDLVLVTHDVPAETGRSIARWGARWWQWALTNPETLDDTDGQFSHLGDVGGPVFYAQGSGGPPVNSSVTIPRDQYVLLPIATFVWTLFDFQDGSCFLVECSETIINDYYIDLLENLYLTIDGESIDLSEHVVRFDALRSRTFKVDVGPCGPGEDPSTVYCGLQDAVQGGYWVMLRPLPVGRHEISFGGTYHNIDLSTGELIDGTTDFSTELQVRVRGGMHDRHQHEDDDNRWK